MYESYFLYDFGSYTYLAKIGILTSFPVTISLDTVCWTVFAADT
jgi:hypothetical protein